MHESEKSDSVVVAGKPTNKAAGAAAEPAEPRTETKGNADQQSTRRAQDRVSVSQALDRVRQAARQRKKERFIALLHHVDPAMLRTAFYAMKRDAAPGVDGMTWETYEQDLDRRIEALHAQVQAGAYRALPSRRSYIPKEDGSKRPQAVAALEDKIVQRAVAAVLSVIYEEDFLGFVWVPTKPQPARCAGRTDRRDQQQEGEFHSRRRHPVVFHGSFRPRPAANAPSRDLATVAPPLSDQT